MKYINLTLFCLAVLFVALLSGCGGGGGGSQGSGTTTTADTSATPAPAPTPTPTQTSTVQLNVSYAGTGKAEKTASAETVGLPASTVTLEIHIVNPTTNEDVVASQLVARTAGASQQTVSIQGVPQGTWKVIVRALGNGNTVLGYFNSSVAANAAIVVVIVNTSETLGSISLTPATATVAVGSTQRFYATGTFTPTNNTADLSVLCSWSSSSTSVASIGSHGLATGLSTGSSTIVATLDGKSGSADLTVSGTSPTPTPSPSASPTVVGTSVCQGCHTAQPFANYYHAGDAIDSTSTSVTYMDLKAYGSIYNIYAQSVHGLADAVTCEGCHGGGSQHYGTGPIPYYMPGIAQCGSCHDSLAPGTGVTSDDTIDLTAFNATGHANPGGEPEKYFFQGGVGTTQATYYSQPEWKDVAGTVPVSKNEHIEECSVCHSPDQKASHIARGDVQDPPQVGCAGCHDPHNPSEAVRNYVTTREPADAQSPAPPFTVLNFKPVQVNLTAPQAGAKNLISGTWIRPRLQFAYKVGGDAAQTFSGYANQGTVGDWLRLTPDRLCAACHAKGQYKYGRKYGSTAISETHNEDVYAAYKLSGHADTTAAPWKKFSLKGGTGFSYRPTYPIDMGGKPGQNGTTVGFDGRMNGGSTTPFSCFRCHNGIATIDYMMGTVGGNGLGDTNKAHIIWGDSTPTCITCHDPHKTGSTTTMNVRVPKYISYNDEFKPANSPNGAGNVRGGVSGKFLDLTDMSASSIGNSIVCLFCHQGRESGWTVWNKVRRDRVAQGYGAQESSDFWSLNRTTLINPVFVKACATTNGSPTVTTADTTGVRPSMAVTGTGIPTSTTVLAVVNGTTLTLSKNATATAGAVNLTIGGISFSNSHYLAAGSLLYGRNSAEFPGKTYSDGIPKHIEKGCTGCHMANTDLSIPGQEVGGHTWSPNIKTCQECHAGVQTFHDMMAATDFDANGTRQTAFEEMGELHAIPATAWERAGETTNGSPVLTNIATGSLKPTMPISGTGIPGGATILSIDGAWQLTISANATATNSNKPFTITNNGVLGTADNPGHGAPLWGTAVGGTGLFGLLNQALWDAGIEYDPDANPYFFKAGVTHNSAGSFKAWTPDLYAAAWNLQQQYKTGAPEEQAAYVHNPFYTAQLLIDSLEATPVFGGGATHLTGLGSGGTKTFASVRPTTATGGTTHTGRDYSTLNVP